MNDDLRNKLTELGLLEEQIGKLAAQGVVSDAEMAMLSEAEIREISGCTVIAAKKIVGAFAPKVEAESSSSVANTMAMQNILPALPDDPSFLELLKVGGVLKIDRTNVIAAMRAAIASDVGLYKLPDILIQRMERFAEEQDEPVGESFYRMQKLLTQRRYGDILSVFETSGSFISERRKKETLARLDAILWPALREFYSQLKSWVDNWSIGSANPGMMMMAVMMSQRSTGVLPPGVMTPPDTAVLRDEGEAVINRINKVFAGTGIPVARALAYDAMKIREVLEDPSLPSTVGAASRDQMLKTLGVDVGADFVRLEQNVTRFTLSIMEMPKVAAGDEELAYFGALYTLGAQIPWDKLGSGRSARLESTPAKNGRHPVLVVGDQPATAQGREKYPFSFDRDDMG